MYSTVQPYTWVPSTSHHAQSTPQIAPANSILETTGAWPHVTPRQRAINSNASSLCPLGASLPGFLVSPKLPVILPLHQLPAATKRSPPLNPQGRLAFFQLLFDCAGQPFSPPPLPA